MDNQTQDLATLVKRLCIVLNRKDPDNEHAAEATDYLRRHGYFNPLRTTTVSQPAVPEAKPDYVQRFQDALAQHWAVCGFVPSGANPDHIYAAMHSGFTGGWNAAVEDGLAAASTERQAPNLGDSVAEKAAEMDPIASQHWTYNDAQPDLWELQDEKQAQHEHEWNLGRRPDETVRFSMYQANKRDVDTLVAHGYKIIAEYRKLETTAQHAKETK